MKRAKQLRRLIDAAAPHETYDTPEGVYARRQLPRWRLEWRALGYVDPLRRDSRNPLQGPGLNVELA